MERSRDDVGKSHELKRTDHVTETSGKPQMIGESHKLTASDARKYIEQVKSKLTGEKFFEFIDIMKDYKAHRIDIPGVKTKLMKMFEGHRELILGLNVFLPKESKIIFKKEEMVMHHSSSSLTKTRSLQSEEGTIASHGERAGGPDPDHEMAHARSGQIRKKKRSATGGRVILSKHKKKAKAFQNLNLSDLESCNPSYRRAPKKYPKSEASQRTAMEKEVLNDDWVSVHYESEGHRFKPSLKNQYEEVLFQCEDDRFEMDMGLERIMLAIKQAEELMTKIYDDSIRTDGLFCLEDYFSGPSLRFIEILYGDYGLDLVHGLRKNVSRGLPIILKRLKQKQEELMTFRSDFNKHWGQVFVKNHQRSLDHRGFCFKQQDSKSLCAKALLTEINKIAEERSKEDKLDHQREREYVPHLEFKYPDIIIHEDLFQLIKISSAKICSSEQLDKVLKIWISFVEPMFGLLPRPGFVDNSKLIAEMSQNSAKNCSNDVKEDGQIMILEFMTDEVELSPIVDLEKGGFSACITDRMEKAHTTKDARKQDDHNIQACADNRCVFYGNEAFYIFFRYHQALYSRLQEAKQFANENSRGLKDTPLNDSYARFLDLLHNYLGSEFREKHEDEYRTSFVTWQGFIDSIERLIGKLFRQLQAIAMDDVDNKLLNLFANEKTREGGRFVDEVYIANASTIVEGKEMFRFECLLVPDAEGQNKLTISQINIGERNMRGYASQESAEVP